MEKFAAGKMGVWWLQAMRTVLHGNYTVRERWRSNATIHDEVPLGVWIPHKAHGMGAEVALVVTAADVASVDELLADKAYDRLARHGITGGEKHIRGWKDLVDSRVRDDLVLGLRRDR